MITDDKMSTNAIAEEINIKSASVICISKIQKKDLKKLIKYEKKYKGVKLSKKGKTLAISIIRKHRLWETFLVKKIKI